MQLLLLLHVLILSLSFWNLLFIIRLIDLLVSIRLDSILMDFKDLFLALPACFLSIVLQSFSCVLKFHLSYCCLLLFRLHDEWWVWDSFIWNSNVKLFLSVLKLLYFLRQSLDLSIDILLLLIASLLSQWFFRSNEFVRVTICFNKLLFQWILPGIVIITFCL